MKTWLFHLNVVTWKGFLRIRRKHDHDCLCYILYDAWFHRSAFYVFILLPSPSLSAFCRKLTVKSHASEVKTRLIIFPVIWSQWKIDMSRARTHKFLDHAFGFSVLTGSMIMKSPWSYFRLILPFTYLNVPDAWSRRFFLCFYIKTLNHHQILDSSRTIRNLVPFYNRSGKTLYLHCK